MAEIFSIAIFETVDGQEAEALATLRDFFSVLAAKEYSRDSLHRNATAPLAL